MLFVLIDPTESYTVFKESAVQHNPNVTFKCKLEDEIQNHHLHI